MRQLVWTGCLLILASAVVIAVRGYLVNQGDVGFAQKTAAYLSGTFLIAGLLVLLVCLIRAMMLKRP